jgi:serralysin
VADCGADGLAGRGALRRFWRRLEGKVTLQLDVRPMTPTFCESFDGPLDIASAGHPDGRWRTNYYFGSDGYSHPGEATPRPDLADSRMLEREAQVYSDPLYAPDLPSPFATRGGVLTISAIANPASGDPKTTKPDTGKAARYISGLITTQGSFRETYGYFEAVVSLSPVRGAFPAFWMLGEPETPYAGDEIDIFEHLGKTPDRLWMSTVLPRTKAGVSQQVDGIDMGRRHAVGLLWTAERLTWFIDREPVFTTANDGFHRPMYLLLNQAVGGWDGNMPEDAQAFPALMRIYSVRAWALPAPGGPPIFKLR